MAAAKGHREGDAALRIEAIYDEERARLKLVLIGGLRENADLFALLRMLLEV